jgi:hypothetical protein
LIAGPHLAVERQTTQSDLIMSTIDELRTLARNAEVCAGDYERGLMVTPRTAVGLWRIIAQLADLMAREVELTSELAAHREAASKRERRAKTKEGTR